MTTDQSQRVKGQDHKVTYRISSNNRITRQQMVVSNSNLVGTFVVRYASRDTLSRSVGQLDRKHKCGRLSASVKISKISGAKLIKQQILSVKNFTV